LSEIIWQTIAARGLESHKRVEQAKNSDEAMLSNIAIYPKLRISRVDEKFMMAAS